MHEICGYGESHTVTRDIMQVHKKCIKHTSLTIEGACKAYQSKVVYIADAPIKTVLRGCNMQ